MATLGSGWLHLAADGYAWQPMATIRPIWWILLCYNQPAAPLVQTALGGVLDLSLSSPPCLAFSGFDSHLRRPPHGCDLHRTVPISTEFFRVTAGKSSRPGPCRCSDSDRRLGPREAKPPAICPSGPSGAFSSSCGVGRANSIRLI